MPQAPVCKGADWRDRQIERLQLENARLSRRAAFTAQLVGRQKIFQLVVKTRSAQRAHGCASNGTDGPAQTAHLSGVVTHPSLLCRSRSACAQDHQRRSDTPRQKDARCCDPRLPAVGAFLRWQPAPSLRNIVSEGSDLASESTLCHHLRTAGEKLRGASSTRGSAMPSRY